MRLVLISSLCLAGCFDFGALGPAPPGDLSLRDLLPLPTGDGGTACTTSAQCASAQNCVDSQCRDAQPSCAAQKAAFPRGADGVYWIAPSSGPQLAYCDMTLGAELCTQSTAMHSGRTREGSSLGFTMMSVLTDGGNACDLWAVRASDGFPLGLFSKDLPGITVGQCQALGFAGDLALGTCHYGTDSAAGYTNCGFAVSPLYAYGHHCVSCMLNTGDFTHYVKMGPFTDGEVLTSVDGATRARCKTH
jgi:hypothetical protein